jgi:hypothetical protein
VAARGGPGGLRRRRGAHGRRAAGYGLAGATLTAPMLRGLIADELPPLCRAYIEPTQEFGALLHPGVPREVLGRAGLVGLGLFLAGVAVTQVVGQRLDDA